MAGLGEDSLLAVVGGFEFGGCVHLGRGGCVLVIVLFAAPLFAAALSCEPMRRLTTALSCVAEATTPERWSVTDQGDLRQLGRRVGSHGLVVVAVSSCLRTLLGELSRRW